jgi:outer membrane biosynthesis protein TonB
MSLKGKLSALRFGRGSRQHIFMSAGVIVAAVVLVSFLTWLNDAHKPIVRSIEEAVGSSLPGVLEQVEGRVAQAATLLGVDEESIQNVREGLAAARSGITGSWAPALAGLPGVGTATTTTSSPEGSSSSSSPATDESSPPQTASEPSAPSSSGGGAGETSSPAPPPATEAPSPITSEPTSPPAVEEEPPPATQEPPPAMEEPSPPPTTEEPPPTPDKPVPPTVQQPPPPVEQLPPATNHPKA